jgi:CRISPR-associated endonuclease Csn1
VPRGSRRRRDRYLRRRDDLMQELIALELMPADEAERQALVTLDPYALRAKAAHGPLPPHELGRALFHLDQRRGFKSNRKTDTSDDNKLTDKIEALDRSIKESGAETLGEYLNRRRLKGKLVRARPEAGFYPHRALYEKEFDKIQEIQAPHQTLRPEQWAHLRDIMFFQRELRPVDPGWCLLEEGERRAHRALPCAQEFRMVQEANNLRILVPGESGRPLSRDQRDRVLKELRTKKELKFDDLLKLLKLPSGARVNLFDENRKALKGDETAARLSHKDSFGRLWHALPFARRTEIVRKLIETESADEIERIARAEWKLDTAAAKKLAATPLPEGYARLSEKAIGKLLPVMEEHCLNYAEAVAEIPEYRHHSDFRPDRELDELPYYGAILTRQVVGTDPTKPKEDEVAHYGRIANPTVHIGLGQLRRLVNRVIKTYGKPTKIVVELARELKMNKEEKEAERRKIRENEAANKRREETAGGRKLSPEDHRRLRLLEEQRFGTACVCPYTGQPISFTMALSSQTEIEHILPFKKTRDDSMANKVLCLTVVNRVKRDQPPAVAFQENRMAGIYPCNYDEILLRASSLPENKRWRFYPDAMERFDDEQAFLDRQLNETKYLSRITRLYLAHLFDEKSKGQRLVDASPGRLTAMLRGKWGLSALLRDHNRSGGDGEDSPTRKNRDDHRHHAIDAFVVAMTDQGLLKHISELNSNPERVRLIEKMDPPWPNFSYEQFRERLDRMVVSHKPDHAERKPKRKTLGASRKVPSEQGKTTGSLHNDTAYGFVKDRDGNIAPGKNGTWKVVSRAALASFLTPKDMDRALSAVRDHTLKAALIAEWERAKETKPAREDASSGDSEKRKKNPAASFAEHVATAGIQLNGRNVKVRRVRLVEELAVVPINDRRTGKPYKAYKPDGNAFADLYRLPTGRCTAVVIRRFDANQPDFDPAKFRPHPAAKKLLRLHIDDMVALEDAGRRRILRVVKMSGQTITLADHQEGGALKKRNDDKDDPFKYLEKSANTLIGMGLRKIGVDEIGRLTDPGPRVARNT